ncbi:MAG TPA: septum formation initiator family protein [Balneolales bacterium]|nr:septum formation initiator family protein [Balneolales bacterium]
MNTQLLNPLRWRKSFLLTLLALFLVIWFGFLDTYSFWSRYELSRRKEDLIEKTAELKKETKELNKKIDNLKNNPQLIEKIAREEYGMRRKGETVYRVKVK